MSGWYHPMAPGIPDDLGVDPGIGPVIGWVAGEPVSSTELRARLAALHGADAATLPEPESREYSRLVRWLALVILTERLCEYEAHRHGLPIVDSEAVVLDQRAAADLGSVTVAAYHGSAAVRAVYAAIAAGVRVPDSHDIGPGPVRYQLRHGLFDDEVTARQAAAAPHHLSPMGNVRLEEVPRALADALAMARRGDLVGPIASGLGWHVAYVDDILTAASPAAEPTTASADLHAVATRRAFADWLRHRRAELVDVAPGLEPFDDDWTG